MEPRRSDERGKMSRSPQSVSKYASSGNKKPGRAWFKFEGDPKYLPKLKGGWISASYYEGKKRPRRDDSESEEDRERGKPKRQRGKPRMPDPGRTCGNCHKVGHTARDCIKVGRSGWMDGACPKCNTPGHLYESCRYRDSKEDVDILFWYRMNKGPVKSALNIGRLLQAAISDENNTRFKTDSVLPPPYTPKYARQIQRDHRWEEWVYYFEGRPEWEAERRKYEPQFYEFTLERIARLFDHAGWTMAAENVNPAGDGPMPSMSRYLVMPSLASNKTTHATEDVGAAAGTAVTEPLLREFNRLLESRGEAVSGPQGTSTTRAVRCSVMTGAELSRALVNLRTARAQNAKKKILGCENCGLLNHDTKSCTRFCGSCNGNDHKMPDCELILDACVCSKFPCHQRFDCKEKCKYCEFAGKTADPHLVTECQEICHYCFAADHLILNCIRFVGGAHDDRDPCRFCNSGKWHLPTNCIEVWCPVRGCKTPIECDEHCPECGWEKHLDKELTDAGKPVHTCLWTKEFDTDTPDRRVVLKCLKNENHQDMCAEDLQERCEHVAVSVVNGHQFGPKGMLECTECKAATEGDVKIKLEDS